MLERERWASQATSRIVGSVGKAGQAGKGGGAGAAAGAEGDGGSAGDDEPGCSGGDEDEKQQGAWEHGNTGAAPVLVIPSSLLATALATALSLVIQSLWL